MLFRGCNNAVSKTRGIKMVNIRVNLDLIKNGEEVDSECITAVDAVDCLMQVALYYAKQDSSGSQNDIAKRIIYYFNQLSDIREPEALDIVKDSGY